MTYLATKVKHLGYLVRATDLELMNGPPMMGPTDRSTTSYRGLMFLPSDYRG